MRVERLAVLAVKIDVVRPRHLWETFATLRSSHSVVVLTKYLPPTACVCGELAREPAPRRWRLSTKRARGR